MIIKFSGKCSGFGGPNDTGVAPGEGLALWQPNDLNDVRYSEQVKYLFLSKQPEGTTGLARRLNSETAHYIACRWDYTKYSKAFLKMSWISVLNPVNGKTARAVPVDWGPNIDTGRVADLSYCLLTQLGLETDDIVEVEIPPISQSVNTAVSISSTSFANS